MITKFQENHTGTISSILPQLSGRILSISDTDNFMNIWDIEEGTLYSTLKGHQNVIHSVIQFQSGLIICASGMKMEN